MQLSNPIRRRRCISAHTDCGLQSRFACAALFFGNFDDGKDDSRIAVAGAADGVAHLLAPETAHVAHPAAPVARLRGRAGAAADAGRAGAGRRHRHRPGTVEHETEPAGKHGRGIFLHTEHAHRPDRVYGVRRPPAVSRFRPVPANAQRHAGAAVERAAVAADGAAAGQRLLLLRDLRRTTDTLAPWPAARRPTRHRPAAATAVTAAVLYPPRFRGGYRAAVLLAADLVYPECILSATMLTWIPYGKRPHIQHEHRDLRQDRQGPQ